MSAKSKSLPAFTPYQIFLIAVLAFLQFTIILDFMIMSPLGALVMPALKISPRQFGLAVSLYAFSAAFSGLMAAGFADRFDRKRLLLFFYCGFILGTVLCAAAGTYHLLLLARVVTGLFGGVVGSVIMAIITDLFALELRGRVMGFIQTAFAASQILGLPAGIYFANLWDWHAPFVAVVILTAPAVLVIMWRMRPVTAHLALKQEHSPWMHLWHTVTERRYLSAFAVTATITTGGFMLMPFSSAFLVNNVKIALDHLPTLYLVTGICTIFVGPLVGRASDRVGKFPVFVFGSILSMTMVIVWTHMGPSSLMTVIIVNVLLFVSIFSRMIPSQALISAIPEPTKRGSFNAVNASLQQFSGGLASVLAGLVVLQGADGSLQRFDWVGYIVIAASVLALIFMYQVHRRVPETPRL
ncbi:MAG TPA: MFS transporter [Rhizomicrobium sp.]|jgi:predicted MFS family arabinose efflux permease